MTLQGAALHSGEPYHVHHALIPLVVIGEFVRSSPEAVIFTTKKIRVKKQAHEAADIMIHHSRHMVCGVHLVAASLVTVSSDLSTATFAVSLLSLKPSSASNPSWPEVLNCETAWAAITLSNCNVCIVGVAHQHSFSGRWYI